MSERRVLVFSKRMDCSGRSPWLVDELVSELIDRGRTVDVFLLDFSGTWPAGKIRERSFSGFVYSVPKTAGRVRKLASIFSANIYFSLILLVLRVRNKYELVVNFSIASFFLSPAIIAKIIFGSAKRLVFVWDFFPIHHQQIGSVAPNSCLGIALKFLEKTAIKQSSVVALMSEENRSFFNNYHRSIGVETVVIPVWGRDMIGEARTIYDSARSRDRSEGSFNVVFGGQIERGRGIETIIEAAENLNVRGENVCIHVLGSGSLIPYLDSKIAEGTVGQALLLHGQLSRGDYRAFLVAMDVGLVVTVPAVSIPSFPSKVIDYFICKVPVIACVEATTDFGEVVELGAKAGLAVDAGSSTSLVEAILQMKELKAKKQLRAMGNNGYQYFLSNMAVSAIVDSVIQS